MRFPKPRDPVLFGLAILLSLLGALFIFDAGYARSIQTGKSMIPREFLMQMLFLPISVFASFIMAKVRPEKWKKLSKAVWILAFVLLVLVEVPGIGVAMNGAHRWIRLGPIPVQPAEFAKLAAIVYLAGGFADRKAWPKKLPKCRDFAQKLDRIYVPKLVRAWPAIVVIVACGLIAMEPDLGTALVILATMFCMFIVGGVTTRSLAWTMLLFVVGCYGLIRHEPYRLERIQHHTNRWSAENVDDIGYQTVQSELAMASGGIIGVGIGAGRAKSVLPATTTDFINATIGEEFGLLGLLIVLGLLAAMVWRLLELARRAPNRFSGLVLYGVASWIAFQTCVNVMMSNGALPAIGIPMPFVSSGGSSLLALWLAMGLCQAVLTPQLSEKEEEQLEADRYRRRNRRTRISRA